MEINTVFSVASGKSSDFTRIFKDLVTKARAGDQNAFSKLYDLYFKKIYQFIYYRVSHKEVAEDLTEDVFLKVYNKIGSLNDISLFEGWLYQIARNRVIDYYRDKQQLVALEEVENILAYDETVLDTLHLEDQQKKILKLISKLTTDQQQVLKMKFFENLENENIAAILDKTEGAVRVIQHRAIQKLQQLVNKELRPDLWKE